MASEGYHEPLELLSAETIEMHRAVQSVIEELEAADWLVAATRSCAQQAPVDVLVH
jgi:hypothetical protein